MAVSSSVFGTSVITQMTSNREISGGARLICAVKGTSEIGWKRPAFGFAAANTAHRVCRLALMPALAMEMRCCSIASCMLDRSLSFILSNSSMAASPRSASTKAPASRVHRPSALASCTAAAVSPAAEADMPDVKRPRGESWAM